MGRGSNGPHPHVRRTASSHERAAREVGPTQSGPQKKGPLSKWVGKIPSAVPKSDVNRPWRKSTIVRLAASGACRNTLMPGASRGIDTSNRTRNTMPPIPPSSGTVSTASGELGKGPASRYAPDNSLHPAWSKQRATVTNRCGCAQNPPRYNGPDWSTDWQ